MKTTLHEKIIEHGLNLLKLYPAAKETDPLRLVTKLRSIEKQGNEKSLAICNGEITNYDFTTLANKANFFAWQRA